MIVYTAISFGSYKDLLKDGKIVPYGERDAYECFSERVSRKFAPRVVHSSDKVGMIMTLNMPDDKCFVSKNGSKSFLEIKQIKTDYVVDAEPFMNEMFPARGTWEKICHIDPAKMLKDKLGTMSEEDKKDGLLPTVAILQAGDILWTKYIHGGNRFSAAEAGNLIKVINEYLLGEYGKAVTERYEKEGIPTLAEAKLIGREYLLKQAKGADKEIRYLSDDIMESLGVGPAHLHERNYKGRMEVVVETTGLADDEMDASAYEASVLILQDKTIRLRHMIQGALYTVRCRDEETNGRIRAKICYYGRPQIIIERKNGEFVVRDVRVPSAC